MFCLSEKKISSSQTAIFKLSISLRILISLLYARVGVAAIRFFCISRPENYISHFFRFYENFVVQYCEYRIKRKHLILALSCFGQHKTPYENEASAKPERLVFAYAFRYVQIGTRRPDFSNFTLMILLFHCRLFHSFLLFVSVSKHIDNPHDSTL